VDGYGGSAVEHMEAVAPECARQRGDGPFIGDARACYRLVDRRRRLGGARDRTNSGRTGGRTGGPWRGSRPVGTAHGTGGSRGSSGARAAWGRRRGASGRRADRARTPRRWARRGAGVLWLERFSVPLFDRVFLKISQLKCTE
jgi:hypothetical protein